MAVNERVQYESGDIAHEQLAPSQSARTEFTPGKASSRPGDMNWPKEFRIPTGTPAFDGEAAGPVEMSRVRVVKLGRNIISDQTVLAPIETGVRIEPVQDVGVCGTHIAIDTETPDNLANRERQAGYDGVVGA